MQKVVITTARPLSEAVLKMVKDKLVKHYGKDLDYRLVNDASVIGGVKVLVGTQEIDATIVRRLNTIKAKLLE